MKKIVTVVFALGLISFASAQKKNDSKNKTVVETAGDHLLLQISSDHWKGTPDSISSHMKGLSRGFNMYVMLNKPFKANPKWSVAFGVGVSTSSMYFKKMSINLKAAGIVLPFDTLDYAPFHYKKYKLATSFLEIPVELRYAFNPETPRKSWKIAIGAKVGTMLNAHTKGKTLQNVTGSTVNGGIIDKTTKKIFFNTTRFAATARVGYGNFSLFGAYQVTSFFKDGSGGADIRPYQVGICLSGL